jgi:positive regulator of sigma E activity
MVVQERGTVESVDGRRARVRVHPARPEACRQCRACEPAGQGVFLLRVEAGDLRPGDRVTVEVPLPGPWRAIGLVLALPLAAMLGGAVLGAESQSLQGWLGLDGDASALLTGLVFAAVALAAAAVCERQFRRRHRPRVTEVRRNDARDGGFA